MVGTVLESFGDGSRVKAEPSLVKVKICGITNLEDAIAAVIAGTDALGFVFYKKSDRYIAPLKARNICRIIPKHILKFGVFVNVREKTVKKIAKSCRLDILQFHGDESPEFCRKFKGYKIAKAFRIKDKLDLKNILKYRTYAYLFDAFQKSKFGGTRRRFNWELLAQERNSFRKPVFLSGGITKNNVKEAIKIVHPDWVDVSSSVELRPGKKDKNKIKRFIKTVKTKTGP